MNQNNDNIDTLFVFYEFRLNMQSEVHKMYFYFWKHLLSLTSYSLPVE